MTLMLPIKGVSMIDAEGQPFYGPAEDAALFETLKKGIKHQCHTIANRKYYRYRSYKIFTVV